MKELHGTASNQRHTVSGIPSVLVWYHHQLTKNIRLARRLSLSVMASASAPEDPGLQATWWLSAGWPVWWVALVRYNNPTRSMESLNCEVRLVF